MKKKIKLLVAALALGVCTIAQGAVINFDAPGVIDIDAHNVAVYNEAGFAIAGVAGSFLAIDGIGSGMRGALVLLANNAVSLTSTDATPFSFSGLDAGLLDASTDGTLSITGFFFDNPSRVRSACLYSAWHRWSVRADCQKAVLSSRPLLPSRCIPDGSVFASACSALA